MVVQGLKRLVVTGADAVRGEGLAQLMARRGIELVRADEQGGQRPIVLPWQYSLVEVLPLIMEEEAAATDAAQQQQEEQDVQTAAQALVSL